MASRTLVALVALLNLFPGVVAVVPSLAERLYGFGLTTPELALTLRHRAVLLAAVGLFLALAAWEDRWWGPAVLLALVSKLSFLGLYLLTSPRGPQLSRVALADLVALVVLAVAALLRRAPG